MRDKRGRRMTRALNFRLALLAADDTDAKSKGVAWFEAERNGPTGHITFGNGRRDSFSASLSCNVFVSEQATGLAVL